MPPAHLAWKSPEIMVHLPLINEAPGAGQSIQWQEAASHSPATQQPTTTDAEAGLTDTEGCVCKAPFPGSCHSSAAIAGAFRIVRQWTL